MTEKTFEGSFARCPPQRRAVRSRSGMRSLLVASAVVLGMGLGATAVFADPPPAGASTPAPTWTKVAAAYPTGPTIRFGAAMAYDPATSQLVLFGGTDNGALGTTWTWTGTAEKWTEVATTGPTARFGAAMAYDPATGQLVLFGGENTAGSYFGTTWTWTGTTKGWTEVATTGPTARSTAAMAYDPAASQLVLFGGADNGALGTTWTWTRTAEKWTKVATTSIFGPRARTGAAMAYDPATSQLLLFGGKSASTTYVTTWAWTGIAEKWTFITPTGPTVGNRGVSMAYDPTTGQLVLFGFLGGKTWTWTRTIKGWTEVATGLTVGNLGAFMAYDPVTRQLVLFGNLRTTWAWVAAPGAPTAVTATAGNGAATVTWTAPTGGGTPITSYAVTSTPTAKSCTWSSGPLTCTVTGLKNGTPYTFTVTATNGVGTGPTSAPASPVTPATVPSAPHGLTAVGAIGKVTLTWTAPVATGGSPLTGYEILQGTAPGAESSTPIATVGATSTAYTDSSITPGTTYYYEVAATNAVGTSAPSTEASATPSAPPATTPTPTSTPMTPTPTPMTPAPQEGYWEVAADGGVFTFGNAQFYGSEGGKSLNAPIVGMAAVPNGTGYWEVAADGGVFTFGNAQFYGSMGGKVLNAPIVGMAAMPNGTGYWEVAADGGVFTFGNAQFYGSMGGKVLNAPVVGMAAMPTGKGYWEVAADGAVFTFGNAQFYGAEGGKHLDAPIVGMAATPSGKGYRLVAADGGVFTFGTAQDYGSMGGKYLDAPVVGMAAMPTGKGYWEVAADGGLFTFGTAPFDGAEGGKHLDGPVVGMAMG